jgi:hypothetical protein
MLLKVAIAVPVGEHRQERGWRSKSIPLIGKIFYINLIYFNATSKMPETSQENSQANRLHPAPVLDFLPARQPLDGCTMTPEPSLSLPTAPAPRKRTGAAATDALRMQARIACLGAAG